MNKRIIKRSIYLIAAVVELQACTIGSPATCSSYILGYYRIEDITASATLLEASDDNQYHHIQIGRGPVVPLSNVFHDFDSDNGMYDEYCKLYNDTSFQTRIVHSLISNAWANCSYPASDFTSITMTCIDDWDATHPKGSSLGDIATFAAVSVAPFINKGYLEYDYDLEDQPELFNAGYPFKRGYGKRNEYPITKLLDNLSTSDLSLLGTGSLWLDYTQICDLYVPKREGGTPCTLRITMTNTDGETFTADVEIQ